MSNVRIRPCCVPGCRDKTSLRYAIPVEDRIQDIWLLKIQNPKLKGINKKNLKNYKVCQVHFNKVCIEANGSLKKFAIPTMNLLDHEETLSETESFSYPLKAQTETPKIICKFQQQLCEQRTTLIDAFENRIIKPEKTYDPCLKRKQHLSNEPDPLDISSAEIYPPSSTGSSSIDLPKNAKLNKSDTSIPPPEIDHEVSSVRSTLLSIPKITDIPVQKSKDIQKNKASDNIKNNYSIIINEIESSKSQDKDDDISFVESPHVVIDLCDDETNDALQSSNNKTANSSTSKTCLGIGTHSKKDSVFLTPENIGISTFIKKDTFFLTPENIGNVCRTCLKQKDVLHMSENKHEERTYAELLEMCSTITLKDDPSLSPYMCQDCINELLQAYNFRDKCTRSEQTLLNFKGELEKCIKKQESNNERQKNLTLRFHDYETILNEDDVNSITNYKRNNNNDSEILDSSVNRPCKKRFYLLKGQISGTEGFKGDVNVTEIDETNAKTLMVDSHQTAVSLQVGNAICNIKTAVVQPEKDGNRKDSVDIPKNSIIIKSQNKRKIIPYSVLLRPAINSILSGRISNINSRILKKKKAPRKRKRNPDKFPKIKDKKPVILGTCHVCNESLNTLVEYKHHSRVTKHYLNPYVCETCGKIYPDQHRLKMHNTINHENRKSHMCEICGKCFKTRSYLLIHLKTHGQKKKFACRICGTTFLTRRETIQHRRLTHTTVEKQHCCEFCGDFFAKPDTLRHHRNRVHLKIKHIFCQVCGKGFQYNSSLKKHMVSHSTHLIDCKLCNKTFKMEHRYLQHVKNQHPGATEDTKEDDEIRVMECDYCDYVCKNKQSQTVHIRVDHEASICVYCDTLFETIEELTSHTKEFHPDIPDFSCRYCGRCFEETTILYAHLNTHKPKYYQCNLCFKKFANTIRLRIHMVFHTREKMFECQYCDKAFLYSSSRVIHERIHTGERPYVCDICGKGNVCISSYKRHRRTHIMPIHSDETSKNEDAVASIQEIKNE